MIAGRVVRSQSGFFRVETAVGVLECRLRGRLKKVRQAEDIAVIGDEVQVVQTAPGQGVIETVAERRSRFSRRQPGPRGIWKEDVMVANLDQVCVVFACANPPMNPRLLDRFLVVAEYNEIPACVVANKRDLVSEAEARAQFARYEAIGYPVLLVSAESGAGIAHLRARLAGRISVFTGPSGVGKSSLLNALHPHLGIPTAAVSSAVGKGRHTTVVAELHPLDSDGEHGAGYVADTPGIRELAAWRIPDEELAWCFPDIRPFLGACEFSDCSHIHEPGCAVLAAVADGRLHPERHESYARQREHAER